MRNRLEELRTARAWTQQEVADRVDVSRQTIISLERGRYNPSILLAVGVAVVIAATVLDVADLVPGWDFRVVGGLGILMLGLGLGLVMRYRPAIGDDAAARRVVVEERDERTVQIRTRAGYRAWILSAVLVWIGLMWASLAGVSNLSLLEGDLLWWFLAAALLVPFVVYAGSVMVDERRS